MAIDIDEDLHCGCILVLKLAVIIVRQKGISYPLLIFQVKSGTSISSLYRLSLLSLRKEVEGLVLVL